MLIRDGRGWARWLYLAFALLITHDVFQILGFFEYDHLLTRVLTGLIGLSSLAALALLFLPEANAYFRPKDGSTGLLSSLFRPRIPTTAAGGRPGAGTPRPASQSLADPAVAIATQPADASMDAAGTAGVVDPASAGRRPTPPRGKSRQSGQVDRNGRR